MHLLFIVFGKNQQLHVQAQFSIFSFLVQKDEINSINIITDTPSFYRRISEYVNVIPVNEEKLKQWQGPFGFFWRIKIKAIELLCNMYKNEPVMYLDTDTFLHGNIKSIKELVQKNTAFMHENEGMLSNDKSKTGKKMWHQIDNKLFGNTRISTKHYMWNAGVVLTPNNKDNAECLLALAICDDMCKQGVTQRLIEQFALSVALQETYGLIAANTTIAHYWSNKEKWNETINQFFVFAYLESNTNEDIFKRIKGFDFNVHAVKVKKRNTNTRLKKVIEKLFPESEISFAGNN